MTLCHFVTAPGRLVGEYDNSDLQMSVDVTGQAARTCDVHDVLTLEIAEREGE